MDVDFASSGAEIVVKAIVRLVEARMASIPVEHPTDHRLPEISALSSAPLGPRTFRELFLCADKTSEVVQDRQVRGLADESHRCFHGCLSRTQLADHSR